MNYLESLNDAQREAVLNAQGPSMIIAGAGSGKTRVLTYRIAYLIQNGVDPFRILSLTFTNKAAREMRERIESVVGTEARNIWMGTFHSVFARILRMEADRLGYPSNFTIYDTDDSKSLLRTIIKEKQLDDKVYKVNGVLNKISSAKNKLISYLEYMNNPVYVADDEASMRPKIGEIYKTYQERLFKSGAMDFDDLLFNTNVLFKSHVDVLNKYQDRFQYVLVDEFQDTNISQYLITRKLSARHRNISVVGDDAQSIYAFRGADIQNILNFEKDYEELKVFKLEQNYRSTQNIVNAANSIINHNKAQLKKSVWTANDTGNLIDVLRANSDQEEGRLVATSIFETKMQENAKNSDFAILYRTNSQSRTMEESLRKLNVKYRIYGGLSFYQRKEIKDVIAYLRFVLNSNDEEALKRIINFPKRGIGATTMNKIFVYANENGLTNWEALNRAKNYLSGRIANAIDQFITMIKSFKIAVDNKDAYEAAFQIARESGLMKELYSDKTVEGLSRHENVQELLNGIKEFVDNPEVEDKSLGAYLQEISLLTDADQEKDDPDVVTLMTIHASKGLEFKYVYIVGLEENLFPSQMMLNSRADLEEERRLFYVAITRAEKNLTLSYAFTRYRFGRLISNEPSRFLNEIDEKFLSFAPYKHNNPHEMMGGNTGASRSSGPPPRGNNTNRSLIQSIQKQKKSGVVKKVQRHTPSPDFVPSDTTTLEEGMKVEHPKFGFGKVTELDSKGNERKAKVNFDKYGEKTLLLSFAKLRILS